MDLSIYDPLDGSAGVCTVAGEVGTLGCFMRYQGRLCALGSAHVMAAGSLGPSDKRLFQPPPTVTGNRPIGGLMDSVVVNRDGQTRNELDAALVELTAPVLPDFPVGNLGQLADFGGATQVGDLVQIHGAGSGGVMSGRVKGVGEQMTVSYRDRSTAVFIGLTRCEVYSTCGDSGAAVLDKDNNLVGVHLCGTATYSWFCPIMRVRHRWPDLEIAR